MTLKIYKKVALPKKVLIGSGGGLGVFKNGFQEITEQYICRYIVQYIFNYECKSEQRPFKLG